MTSGQELALEQIKEMASISDGTLRVVAVQDPGDDARWVSLTVSVSCSHLPRVAGGLPLHGRERLRILLPPGFPFDMPAVETLHTRWGSFPHVQWKRYLCLYQAPTTEWNSADGMFGFIQRLDDWIRKGAMANLDPAGEPLHPPVAYATSPQVMVVRANTPAINSDTWFGYAHLRPVSEQRVDLEGWFELGSTGMPSNVAGAILLSEPMPFEYPATVSDLIRELESRGVSRKSLLTVLGLAALRNEEEKPLYVVIGTPMRGVQGGERRQHLTAWYLSPTIALGLRLLLNQYEDYEPLRELGDRVEGIILDWAGTADVSWCSVLEDRPEVTIRRDIDTPIRWFSGRTVAIWGCGALGSHIAEHLARCGVGKLVLRDSKRVKPGILARQQFDEADIGASKAHALSERVRRIRPNLEVVARSDNILRGPLESDWTDGAEVVIDATASEVVLSKLEMRRSVEAVPRVPVVSVVIGHRAENALVVIAQASHSGGPADVSRRTKVDLCNRAGGERFLDEFWPERARHTLFQPEPGCSDTTFVGSSADVAALASAMLNLAAADLAAVSGYSASAHLLSQPLPEASGSVPSLMSFQWTADVVGQDPESGYETRISRSAWDEMLAWASRSRRLAGPMVETGGLLFGQADDACKVIWVSEVIGPPPDSEASAELFLCGTAGTVEVSLEKDKRTRQSVRYVGMWHTHPASVPVPSGTDLEAMRRLTTVTQPAPARSLLVILRPDVSEPSFGTFVFRRADFEVKVGSTVLRRCLVTPAFPLAPKPRRIGLALSGGGSRAIAFHLGCLRALNDRGLLGQIEIISAVSGGSVIAGMYAYSHDSFGEFDARVVRLLRAGLQGGIVRRTFLSRRFAAIVATSAVSGTASLAANVLRTTLGSQLKWFQNLRPPWIRWVSRTSALEAALRDLLFGDEVVTGPRREDVNVVFNACELRTATAFRFGNLESRCWRFGKIAGNDVKVAQAIAASAAYPVIFPAIDRTFTFEEPGGREAKKRVLLTDGGVYDNLGLSCLEPGRAAAFGYKPFSLDYIVACDAGAGQFSDDELPYGWAARMIRSFESVFRRVQSGSHAKLHELGASGGLKGFALPYLGQQDDKLGYCPPDLVRRDQVKDYPTNFSPMKQGDIDLLALRGEQLTRLMIDRYCSGI